MQSGKRPFVHVTSLLPKIEIWVSITPLILRAPSQEHRENSERATRQQNGATFMYPTGLRKQEIFS